jgi:hypothetical protein
MSILFNKAKSIYLAKTKKENELFVLDDIIDRSIKSIRIISNSKKMYYNRLEKKK